MTLSAALRLHRIPSSQSCFPHIILSSHHVIVLSLSHMWSLLIPFILSSLLSSSSSSEAERTSTTQQVTSYHTISLPRPPPSCITPKDLFVICCWQQHLSCWLFNKPSRPQCLLRPTRTAPSTTTLIQLLLLMLISMMTKGGFCWLTRAFCLQQQEEDTPP